MNLSPQRMVVLAGLANGKSNQEMARAMGISVGTVRSHVSHLYRKLRVHDRAHAVAVGFKLKLIVPGQVVGPGECSGIRTSPNWCQCRCKLCKTGRCDLHGGAAERLERLGDNPSYFCFMGRHTSCDEPCCSCTCGHNSSEEDE